MTKPKLMLYTDCDFFAGCEKPIENITNFSKITEKYNVIFVYRYNKKYKEDIKGKNLNAQINPIMIPNPNSIIRKIDEERFLFIFFKIIIRLFERLQVFNLIFISKQLYVLIKEKPDIVHINNGGYPGADSCRMMAISCGLLRINKIVFTVNNMAVPAKGFIDKCIDYFVNTFVDNFVTASNAAALELQNIRKIGAGKTQSIPNAVLKDRISINENVTLRKEFNISEDTILIGSAGLLIERKGYDILIKAANLISKDINWCIFVFGDGDQRKKLEKMIKQFKLKDRFFLPGFRENIHSYINDLDIFTLPSTGTEDMPNAINEAMLIGKPVVGTKTSGVPEQIDHGINGFLVNPGDYKDLAIKLEYLLKLDPNELKKAGIESNKKYIDSFSYNLAMNKYLITYDS